MTIVEDLASTDRVAALQRLRPALVRYSRRRLFDPTLAEDCAQEVLTRAVEMADRFEWRGPGSFDAWVMGIARHVALEMSRHAGRTVAVDAVPEQPAVNDVADSIESASDRARLAVAFAKLSDTERTILELRFVAGSDARSAGEVVGMEAAAVRMAQMRARRRLRVLFDSTAEPRHARPPRTPRSA